jgi:hypothetical protein
VLECANGDRILFIGKCGTRNRYIIGAMGVKIAIMKKKKKKKKRKWLI